MKATHIHEQKGREGREQKVQLEIPFPCSFSKCPQGQDWVRPRPKVRDLLHISHVGSRKPTGESSLCLQNLLSQETGMRCQSQDSNSGNATWNTRLHGHLKIAHELSPIILGQVYELLNPKFR